MISYSAKRRIKQLVEMGEDFTEQDVADELEENSNILDNLNIRARERKREQVKEALEENPEKSNVQIAEELDVSDPFVGKVRREIEEEESLRTTTHSEFEIDGVDS